MADPFGQTPLMIAVGDRDRPRVETLLASGADINARSTWWAGGFGVLDLDSGLEPFLIERGAVVDAHAASRLGMFDRLKALVEADARVVHARGGDGQTPLHFARTVAIAEYLLDHGADIDARDIDHESTPAQYMVRDRQDVARFLVARGCHTDILMAAALGDLDLVRRHLADNPAAIHMSVSERAFPKRNPHSGGTIYTWTLGSNKTPHAVARQFGHDAIVRFLMDLSPDTMRLALACEFGDEAAVAAILAAHPDLEKTLPDNDRRKIVNAAMDSNAAAVRLMLAAGWPAGATDGGGVTALHWAAFHGHAEMAREILRYQPPIEAKDAQFQAAPIGWAIHGSLHGWHPERGDYAGVVSALLAAGATAPALTPQFSSSDAVREVIARHHAQSRA